MKKTISLQFPDQFGSARLEVFHKLKSFSDKFILAGGTAIMLQICHRLSYDFDCFSSDPLQHSILRKINRIFGKIIPMVNNSEILMVKTGEGIDLHWVCFPYPHLRKLILTDSLPLAHLDDLAANKAFTIGRRGAWRDYVDLFFLLKWKYYDLSSIIQLAERKFKGEFHDKLFLEQLTYFTDLDIAETKFLKESYSIAEIKTFLEKEAGKYVKNRLKL